MIFLKITKQWQHVNQSEKILSHLVEKNKFLIGGSADLSGSNNTKIKSHKIIKANDFKGNYIHYGVREHAMCAVMNGIALHSNSNHMVVLFYF